jgi:phosphoketolase
MKKSNEVRSPELLRKMGAFWRAANYLSVGQIYPDIEADMGATSHLEIG